MKTNVSAQLAYSAYGNWLGWKNAQGHAIPSWNQLPDQMKNAWTAAIETVVIQVRKETVNPLEGSSRKNGI